MLVSWFERAFAALPAPRTGNAKRAKRYELLETLAIALTAFASAIFTVIGQESFRAAEGGREIVVARPLTVAVSLAAARSHG